ncbi:unnamed protein product [Amaranthus hypochondriacus]
MENSDILKKRLEWMKCDDRASDLFLNGVKEFLNFAFGELNDNDYKDEEEVKLPCPCNRCNNSKHKTKDEIFSDLLLNGIVRGYVRWIYHGEFEPSKKRNRNQLGDDDNDDILRMIYDKSGPAFFVENSNVELDDEGQFGEDGPIVHEYVKGTNEAKLFNNLMKNAEKPLYPGCDKYSKLSFVLKLFQIKCMDGMTNKVLPVI